MGIPRLVQGNKEFEINKQLYTIGRDEKCDLCISYGLISKVEATIIKRADGYYLKCGGRGGTKLKRGKLEEEVKEIKLQDRDIICIGGKTDYKFVIS